MNPASGVLMNPARRERGTPASDRDALECQRERAEDLGARLLLDRADDDDEPLYVFADPSGHPFCVFVGLAWTTTPTTRSG